MELVAIEVPCVRSTSSALAKLDGLPSWPPAMSSSDGEISVAVCWLRAMTIEPAGLHCPSTGSYSSMLERSALP